MERTFSPFQHIPVSSCSLPHRKILFGYQTSAPLASHAWRCSLAAGAPVNPLTPAVMAGLVPAGLYGLSGQSPARPGVMLPNC